MGLSDRLLLSTTRSCVGERHRLLPWRGEGGPGTDEDQWTLGQARVLEVASRLCHGIGGGERGLVAFRDREEREVGHVGLVGQNIGDLRLLPQVSIKLQSRFIYRGVSQGPASPASSRSPDVCILSCLHTFKAQMTAS